MNVQHRKGIVVCAVVLMQLADDGSCPARAQEMEIMEVIEQKRCTRHEA